MSIQEYRDFIASKTTAVRASGMEPKPINASVKMHQTEAINYALSAGKAALFLDTGLGKSLCELEFARQVADETRKPVLILTPLAVAGQMVREGQKFGIDARQIKDQSEVGQGVMVANYERLHCLDTSCFGGVVLDESSILKSFAGQTRGKLLDAFRDTPFRLAATATPSPNDHTELGNHAEFLGVMRQQEMLSKWFINDTSTASQDWRLKGHAVEPFWSWVASWARCATLPSDLGGDDTGYVLPEIDRRIHKVAADRSQDAQGALFRMPEMSATSFHAEKRLTLEDRCERAVSLVFADFRDKLAVIGSGDTECLGSQNTQSGADRNTNPTQQSVSAEKCNAGPPKKIPNTCANTTIADLKNSSALQRQSSDTTQQGAQNTPPTQNTPRKQNRARDQEARPSGATTALSHYTGSANLTMSECSKIRDVLAPFVRQITKKSAAKFSTSITATQQEKSDSCSAQPAIPPSEKCATTLADFDPQSPIWNAIKSDPWLVFCETNDEQDALERAFGDLAFSVRGSDSVDEKERRILAWCDGDKPILISKTKIVGFGMNFQHCRNVLFASVNFSYESFYQGVRRVWRFGQERQVNVHIVIADTEGAIWQAIHGKAEKHDEMKRRMSAAMGRAQNQAGVRVRYDRPLDLAFPDWLKTQGE